MSHTNNPIIKHKAGLLNLAEELGNATESAVIDYVIFRPAHGQTSNQ